MNWRCALRAAAVLAQILALLALWACDARGEEIGGTSPRRNTFGFAGALYHNRFIDDVISPVVYTSSSPLYELFYRYMSDVQRHTVSLKVAIYNSGLRDSGTEDSFEIYNSKGIPYTYPLSMYQLDGSQIGLEYAYSRRILTFEQGRSSLHLGGNAGFYTETLSGLDRWGDEFEWTRVKTWFKDFSIAFEGYLERRFRKYDRLSFGLHVAVISYVSRAPYYYTVGSSDEVDPDDVEYSWMFPNDFLRWSSQLSYELWLSESFALDACYVFQHQRISEPRDLRYISHTLGLGVKYAFKPSK